MYESQSYDVILKRMLDRVPITLDKREGSVVYDALAPAAAELAQMYIELDGTLRLGFGETTSGVYLDRRTSDRGVTRKPASPALRKGMFWNGGNQPFDVPIGSRYSCEQLNFVVKARLTAGQYELECEAVGESGNSVFGVLLPIDYVAGLACAELTDVLLPGEDTESDDQLRIRFLQKVREPGTSGNVADYRRWATEAVGVGAAKVVPLWDGPGTVKVVIVDTERQPATPSLVSDVAAHIEEVRPIGAAVTVVSAIGLAVEVAATVTLASGYSLQMVQDSFIQLLEAYLRETAFELTYVSYARIGTLLIGTSGVLDYTGLTVNGSTGNVALQSEEVPVVGAVNLGV
ncbi:baseplate J/gp47 family protein [Paenibacillus contaminans]|uniref:Baseplate J protein n=1 Tax=Paenibacillus contaminans TaxID=450362 RepID=A0A329MIE4_9BACL|nr:baseplate J/gp47 family protein [Paenibacillus contaminans]RAV19721.1 baseplate J protein [Paenibacillus contaminans]